jgi:hypothetical protein
VDGNRNHQCARAGAKSLSRQCPLVRCTQGTFFFATDMQHSVVHRLFICKRYLSLAHYGLIEAACHANPLREPVVSQTPMQEFGMRELGE